MQVSSQFPTWLIFFYNFASHIFSFIHFHTKAANWNQPQYYIQNLAENYSKLYVPFLETTFNIQQVTKILTILLFCQKCPKKNIKNESTHYKKQTLLILSVRSSSCVSTTCIKNIHTMYLWLWFTHMHNIHIYYSPSQKKLYLECGLDWIYSISVCNKNRQ